MKLTKQQLIQLIRESAMKVINEIGYHEKQEREVSDKEHEDWVRGKAAAKRREADRKEKERGEEKPGKNGTDYYAYKHGRLKESNLDSIISRTVSNVLNETRLD